MVDWKSTEDEKMAAGIHLPDHDETIDLQQQVARLQALLEASRHVHSTISEEEVLESVLRIVVREGLSADLARALHDDARTALASLDKLKPSGHYKAEHFAH